MAGALEHIRVIDFGQYIAGPLAGMLLADQGADVVRVDPPGGPSVADAGQLNVEPGQAEHNPGPQAFRGRSYCPLPHRERRRGDRELPTRHHGPVGVGTRGDDPRQPPPGVLLHPGICVGRSPGGHAGLRRSRGSGVRQLPPARTTIVHASGLYGHSHRLGVRGLSSRWWPSPSR